MEPHPSTEQPALETCPQDRPIRGTGPTGSRSPVSSGSPWPRRPACGGGAPAAPRGRHRSSRWSSRATSEPGRQRRTLCGPGVGSGQVPRSRGSARPARGPPFPPPPPSGGSDRRPRRRGNCGRDIALSKTGPRTRSRASARWFGPVVVLGYQGTEAGPVRGDGRRSTSGGRPSSTIVPGRQGP